MALEMTTKSKRNAAKRSKNTNPKIESSCNYANFTSDITGNSSRLHHTRIFTNGRFIVEFIFHPGSLIVFDTFYQIEAYVHSINYLLAVSLTMGDGRHTFAADSSLTYFVSVEFSLRTFSTALTR